MRKKILNVLTILAYVSVSFFGSQMAYAADCNPTNTKEAIQCGSSSSSGIPVSNQPDQSLTDTLKTTINYLSLAIGAVAVIMILVGGFRYVTSSGNQEAISAARKTITYALIGLIIAAVSQLLVHFVLSNTNDAINGTATNAQPAVSNNPTNQNCTPNCPTGP
jgi:Type IV secretion system pilin